MTWQLGCDDKGAPVYREWGDEAVDSLGEPSQWECLSCKASLSVLPGDPPVLVCDEHDSDLVVRDGLLVCAVCTPAPHDRMLDRLGRESRSVPAMLDLVDSVLLQVDEETPDSLVPFGNRLSANDAVTALLEAGFGYRPKARVRSFETFVRDVAAAESQRPYVYLPLTEQEAEALWRRAVVWEGHPREHLSGIARKLGQVLGK